jgi:hypothetical protein
VPWSTVQAELERSWEQGQHVTIAAPTGHGKTHLALALADLSRYVLVLATKRRDELVAGLQAHGWKIVGRFDEILWAENEPITRKVVVWPQPPEKASSRERAAFLTRELREVLASAQRTGMWTIIADETMYLSEQLQLERELNELWYAGRSLGVSLVSLMQRPARVPRLAFSQASYLFVGKFNDRRDIETLREIATVVPKPVMEAGITSLSKPQHEFLFVDCIHDRVAITVAPPR